MKTSEILFELRRISSTESPSPEECKFVQNRITDEKFARFFFQHAKGSQWIEELRDFFESNRPDNPSSGYPYLFHLSENNYGDFVNFVQMIKANLNYYGFSQIIKVATSVQPKDAVKLSPVVESYLSSGTKKSAGGISDYLKHIFIPGLYNNQLWSILNKILYFLPDPESEDKQEKQKNSEGSPDYWTTALEPVTRIDAYEYQQILEQGIRPLCEKDPYQIARILINATERMIRLSKHQEDLDKEGDEDSSEIWCRRLNALDNLGYSKSKEMLVHTLTFACRKVYEKFPESVEELDQILRKKRWKVFKRLRQHLYSLNPTEQTLPWIREFILEHKDYAKWEHHYEFQLMIRKACDHFGTSLLSEEERTTIFDTILSGPSKKDFRQWMGEKVTEEGFQKLQHDFHRMQLRPFEYLLTGKYQNYFQELEDASDEDFPSDEDYSPISKVEGGIVSYRSPRSPEELAEFGDEGLLTYINTWQEGRPWYEEHRYEDDQWIEINIGALADAFQTMFKDTIISDEKRLTFWLENRDGIERPVYIRAIVRAIQEHVKEQNYERLDLWFEFCEWVLSHPDAERDQGERGDESREHPDWGSSRRAVGDFIGECLKEETSVPFTERESLENILRLLCTQFDRRLDLDEPVLLNRNDQITEAINNTRSRALEDLVKFGFWVRRHNDTDNVPEVTAILEERFKDDANYSLTMPEHAQLGRYYIQLWDMNQRWAVEHKAVFFPQDNLPIWVEAFGSFLRFTRPFKPIFEILRDDFVFALDHLPKIEDNEIVDTQAQRLFTYYLWEVYPLKGEDSLLERFYEKTKNDPQRWASLSNYVAWAVGNRSEDLEQGLIDRIVAFFDWRLEQKEPEELQKIAYCLEAECFDPDWRLDTYAKILDVGQLGHIGSSSILNVLNEMLESHTEKVVGCFVKITDTLNQGESIYIGTDEEAKAILRTGLDSENESIRENAEQAQENLLNAGRYGFLDI